MRRKAKASTAAPTTQAADADQNGSAPAEEDPTMVEQAPVEQGTMAEQPDEQTSDEPVGAPSTGWAPPSTPGITGPDYRTTGDGGDPRDFTVNHYLELGDLFASPRNLSEEERQRMAAADFQAAIAPAYAGREGGPPAAATPDDAVREFVETTGPALPDPDAGTDGNIYANEATAYMRIRRHFGKGIGRPGGPWVPPPGLVPGSRRD